MPRQAPTSPKAITPALIDAALAKFNRAMKDRDAFKREKATGGRHRVLAFRASGLVSERTEPVKDCRCSQCRECLARLQRAKTRIVEQRLPVKAPPKKRLVEKEDVTKDGSVKREIVRSPFTMPATLREALEEMLRSLKLTGKFSTERRLLPQSSQRPTRIDVALEAHEAAALSRYLEDRATEAAVRSHETLSDREWKAIDRLRFVHARLIVEDRDDLRIFARMCVPIDDIEPLSTRELGALISKTSARDICEGACVGAIRKIAQRLAVLLNEWKRLDTIQRKEAERRAFNYAATCRSMAA